MEFSYSVSSSLGVTLGAYAQLRNVDFAPLAKAVGIDPHVFARPPSLLNLQDFCSLLDILATVSGDDCFGLAYSQTLRLDELGAFAYATLNAPTVREAVQTFERYRPLLVDTPFCDIDIGRTTIVFSWRYSGLIDKPDQFTDLRTALGCRLFGALTPIPWRPVAAELIREKPRSTELHRELFLPGIRFGSAMNVIVFPSNRLDDTVPKAQPKLYELMTGLCENEMQKRKNGKDLRVAVKSEITGILPTRSVTLARIAGNMGMGDRTLQRRLAELGTTFEQILEETRADLSGRLLTTTTLPLGEIGYLCGYANPSAYSRAAKAWHGQTPLDYRRKALSTNLQIPTK